MVTANVSLGHRWFAFLWSRMDAGVDHGASDLKDELFVDLPDRILEIGAGRGANFRRYPAGARLVAFEPNRHMHHVLRRVASEHDLELDLRGSSAEALDLPDESFDLAVSTFTLCSVTDRRRAVSEIVRVLRPGGRFVFIEHIVGEPGTDLARTQRLMRLPWALLGDRCDLLADTHRVIETAGFGHVDRRFTARGSSLDPSRRLVCGTAVKEARSEKREPSSQDRSTPPTPRWG